MHGLIETGNRTMGWRDTVPDPMGALFDDVEACDRDCGMCAQGRRCPAARRDDLSAGRGMVYGTMLGLSGWFAFAVWLVGRSRGWW